MHRPEPHKVAILCAYNLNPMREKAADIKPNRLGNFTSISLPAHSRLVSLILSQII
jgi:hypothetical protein